MNGEKPRLVTSGELARELGVASRTVAYYARHGQLKPAIITPGGQYRWNVEDVKRQLREMRQQPE